jgi:mRNA interferase YafQ
MLAIRYTTQAKKDIRMLARQGKDVTKLASVLNDIAAGKELPAKIRDHALTGNYTGYRECHIEPDWLLIYLVNGADLYLTAVRTGSHSELFG